MTKTKALPQGVRALSTIEMWERFSFYMLQTLLVLYANDSPAAGGLGWSAEAAIRISGTYGAFVYISPVVGGFIADRFLGRRLGAAVGAVLMGIGQLTIMIHSTAAFYCGLSLLVLGCGLLKPSLSAMVGEFFSEQDHKRHSAFAVFYMAINIGALMGTFLSGLTAQHWGYRSAFLLGALGFIIALINLTLASRRSLSKIGLRRTADQLQLPPLMPLEKKRIKVYLGMCIGNIVWNIIYAMPFGLLTYYAAHNIHNDIGGYNFPVTWYLAFYALLIIIFSYGLAKVYDYLHSRNVSLTVNRKLSFSYWFLVASCVSLLPLIYAIEHNPQYMGSPWPLITFYILFSVSELLSIPVMLSAATQIAPKAYAAIMVSANISISWGLGSYLGGEVGALTLHYSAIVLFSIMIVISALLAIGHKRFDAYYEKLIGAQ
jgi:POT family proton-dependent oligopeptide transporter